MVVSFPPGISLWFLIHPFARWWRRLGPGLTYLMVTPLLISIGYVIYRVREPLLRVRFGLSAPLMVAALPLFLLGAYIGVKRMRLLTPSVMLGVPELSRSGRQGRLLTGGIYSRVRHPRYLELGFILAAIALFLNYLAVYVMLLLYVPVIYLVVVLEERELRGRFGPEYERYCRRVPRFMPKIGRLDDTDKRE
jgi:protein-S-isoprenylcysteine O-methyltransferase Ste14